MKRQSRKLSYANVVSTLCLFLLIGGGTAFAANQILAKNSVGSKQLKKGAVTPTKLSAAAKSTLTGPKGDPGPTGAQGPQGLQGDRGEAGEPGPRLATLPSGETEYGTIGTRAEVSSGEVGANAQLPIPAPVPLSDATVQIAPEAPCAGSAAAPTAPPGYVCVYPYFAGGEEGLTGIIWGPEVSRFGFQISWISISSQSAVFANWAYTAP